MRIVLVAQAILVILGFICGRYIDSIFLVLYVFIGAMAVRTNDGFSLMQLSCYFFMNVFQCIWSFVLLILFFCGVNVFLVPAEGWVYVLFMITVIAGPIMCLLGAITSRVVYNEIRDVLMNELSNGMGGDDMESGYYGQQQQQQQEPRNARAMNARPTEHAAWGGSGAVGGGTPVNPYRDPNYRAGGVGSGSGDGANRQPNHGQGQDFKAFSGQGHVLGG